MAKHSKSLKALIFSSMTTAFVLVSSISLTAGNGSSSPPTVYSIVGYVWEVDGVTPALDCPVSLTISNVYIGVTTTDNAYGFYSFAVGVGTVPEGSLITVVATKGSDVGREQAIAHPSEAFIWIDITLSSRFELALVAGWNQITLPFINESYTAGNIGLSPGDVVAGYNSTIQGYDKTFIVGVTPPSWDFPIKTCTGYEVFCSAPRTLVLYGTFSPTASVPVRVPAYGGWVELGLPSLMQRRASEIPSMYSGGSLQVISMWDPIILGYRTYIPGLPLDFVILPGQGFWAFATTSGTFRYIPPRPVASFTYAIDGMTVNVNASGSTSEAGIVNYTWDWGDGTSSYGKISTHTYGSSAPASSAMLATRGLWQIFGQVFLQDGVTPVGGATVTVTNTRSGYSETMTTDPEYGYYACALDEGGGGPPDSGGPLVGDLINVTATKGTMIGWNQATVEAGMPYTWLNVTLSAPTYNITLKVTDAIGNTDTYSVLVQPYLP